MPSPASPSPPQGTRVALGCAAAFLGLFLLMGLLTAASALFGSAAEKTPALVVGGVFALVGGAGVFLVRWLWKETARREQRRLRAPDQPWAWDQDVSGGVVAAPSPAVGITVWVAFAALWLGMVGAMTVLAWDKLRAEPGLLAVLGVFWVAGLFLASMAVRAILQARRFGRSSLALDAVPARLGGWLSGVVRGPLAVHGAELHLTVECVRSVSSGQRGSRSTWTLWRETKVIDGARCERAPDHVAIPFAVRLPTVDEVTREQNDNALGRLLNAGSVDLVGEDIDWYVAVDARLPGVDYGDRFTVPVAPPEPGAARVAASPPRAMPELAGERLSARMPGRLEHNLDADVFVFPVKPVWVAWAVGPLALAAACLAQRLVGGIPLLEAIGPDALFWVGLVPGILGTLSLLGLMLDTRRIEVAAGAVRVRRGWLGVGFHRTIPREAIAAVDEEATKSNPPSYSVNIRVKDGTSYWAAISLREPQEAKALAARLREILQLRP